MLATLIPLFDNRMSVSAYSVFARKTNLFLNPSFMAGARFDGAGTVLENYANNPALMLGAGAKELVQVEMSAGDKWYREWKAKLSALPDGHPQKAQAMQFVEQVYSEFCKLKAKF